MPRRPDLPPLTKEGLDPDPIVQFNRWHTEAAKEVPLAEAMTLATADADGFPDARMVLLKGVDAEGFRFHSNRDSIKGTQLRENPRAALVVYWREMDRQVRVRGAVEQLSDAESDEYFQTRPRERRLSAWASVQSSPLADRSELERRWAEVDDRFPGEVPRPPNWGGYLVRPQRVEFWQGVPERLHDRIVYVAAGAGAWTITRLSP